MTLKYLLFIHTSLLIFAISQAQNFVPNPGFENFNTIPDGDCLWHYTDNWTNVNGNQACIFDIGSPDYYHTLGTGIANTPLTHNGEALPFEGDAMMGIVTRSAIVQNFREYISVELTEPLRVGTAYIGSFYYTNGTKGAHPSGWGAYGTEIGMHVSVGPMNQNTNEPIILQFPDPVYESFGSVYSNDWQRVEFIFAAEQDFTHLTIGNFRDDGNTTYSQFEANASGLGYAYYFIDEVSIVEASVLPISLLQFQAIPLDKGIQLQWETGRLESTTQFLVEKSEDGQFFNPYLQTEGEKGQQFFELKDKKPTTGSNYYRLRYQLSDGLVGFSNIIEVTLNSEDEWEISPTLLDDSKKVTIKYSGDGFPKAKVQLLDIQGTMVKKEDALIEQMLSWNLSNLPSGVYFLRIESSAKPFHTSIMIP